MLKTFIAGIVIGAATVAAALYLTPVVDVAREASVVSVTPTPKADRNGSVVIRRRSTSTCRPTAS